MPTTTLAVTASPTVINALVNQIAGEPNNGFEAVSQQPYLALFTYNGANFPINFSQETWQELAGQFYDWRINHGTPTENFQNWNLEMQQSDNQGRAYTIIFSPTFLTALYTAVYNKWHSNTTPPFIATTITVNTQ